MQRVKEFVESTPQTSIAEITKHVNVAISGSKAKLSPKTVERIVKGPLRKKTLKVSLCSTLKPAHKKARLQACQTYISAIDSGELDVDKIIFSDEAWFSAGARKSKSTQNSRCYVDVGAKKADLPPSVITVSKEKRRTGISCLVSVSVCSGGVVDCSFVPGGVSINARSYISHLEDNVVPNALLFFPGNDYVWQEDGASSHTDKAAKEWKQENTPKTLNDFFKWPAKSHDLAPNDYWLWARMNQLLDEEPEIPSTVQQLKAAVLRATRAIDRDECNRALRHWRKRLEMCVRKGGDRFEFAM